MAEYSNKILKGDELYYYTVLLKQRLHEMEQASQAAHDELQDQIDDLDERVETNTQTIIDNKEEVDATIADLIEKHDDDLEKLEKRLMDLKLQTKLVASAVYTDHGTTLVDVYDEYGRQIKHARCYLYLIPDEFKHQHEDDLPDDPASEIDKPNIYNEYIWVPDNFDLSDDDPTQTGSFELIGSTDMQIEELTEQQIIDIWEMYF